MLATVQRCRFGLMDGLVPTGGSMDNGRSPAQTIDLEQNQSQRWALRISYQIHLDLNHTAGVGSVVDVGIFFSLLCCVC